MAVHLTRFLTVLILVGSASSVLEANEREQIHFIDVVGQSVTTFVNMRSTNESTLLLYESSKFPNEKAIFKDMDYFFPNDYVVQPDPQRKGYNQLLAKSGITSRLTRRPFDSMRVQEFRKNSDGSMLLTNENVKSPDGKPGLWTGDPNFSVLAVAWIFPSYVEVLEKEAKPTGEWRVRGNTVSYFGKNVNHVVFKVKFRFRSTGDQQRILQQVGDLSGVEVVAENQGVRITLLDSVLFQSGSAVLGSQGQDVLKTLLGELKQTPARIVVSGHTDNVPIQGALQEKFPSNWHLSSSRALAILDILLKGGIEHNRLHLEASGATRPRADNSTAQGRAQNRRIEILLQYGEA